jgi:hypothetical protein
MFKFFKLKDAAIIVNESEVIKLIIILPDVLSMTANFK